MVLKSVQERRCEKRREEARRVVESRGERTTKQEFGRGVGGGGFARGLQGVARGLRGVIGKEKRELVVRSCVAGCCGSGATVLPRPLPVNFRKATTYTKQ